MFSAEMMNETSWQQYFDMNDKHGQTNRLAKGMAAHNMRELPVDFRLGEHDVICGRGRKCFHHIGNQRFRELVLDMLEKYSDSPSKLDKSYIICDVVNTIRKRSPFGGFVKFDAQNSRYYEVGDFLAREKTSQAFRDALHEQYKSSNSQKKKRRWVDHEKIFERQNSAPLLCVSSIRDSLEDDVVGMRERGNDSYHSLQSESNKNFNPTVRALRPELMNKLCRQQSAPSLFYSYAEKYHSSPGQLTPETAHSLSNSSRSLYAASETSEESYRTHDDDNHSVLLSVATNIVSNKRRAFAGTNRHQSMRSVMEDAAESPEWLNRSCPNLMASLYEPNNVEFKAHHFNNRDSFVEYTIEDCKNESMFPVGRPDMILEEGVEQCIESPQKRFNQILNVKNHEEFLLSPIGDGSVDGLFEILKGMDVDDDNANTDDIFEPLPF